MGRSRTFKRNDESLFILYCDGDDCDNQRKVFLLCQDNLGGWRESGDQTLCPICVEKIHDQEVQRLRDAGVGIVEPDKPLKAERHISLADEYRRRTDQRDQRSRNP
jgi:hypothetical protein